MQYDRRKFIKLTGGLTTGLALGSLTGASLFSSCNNESDKIKEFGLQLYTLRDDLPKDPKGVLKQVATAGYNYVESYEHDQLGMFWGMSPADFKKYLAEIGLTIQSSHCDVNKDFEKKAAEAASIGMKYLIYPYEGSDKTIDDYKKLGEEFNKKGEICKKNGLRFAFHNHDYSFLPINGVLPQNTLLQNTDPSLVDFQLDIYWAVTAKQDPVSWINNNPGRFNLVHVKDRMKGTDQREATCTLGEGSINYAEILKAVKSEIEYFVVEQERYDGTTPLKAIEADAAYMKKVKV
jgi:sugar phosphate isomerase/epimerase